MLACKSLSVKRKIFCFLRSLDKFQQLLHLFLPLLRVTISCRPSLLSQYFITDTFLFAIDYSSVTYYFKFDVLQLFILVLCSSIECWLFQDGPIHHGSFIFMFCHASCGHGLNCHPCCLCY